VNLSKSVSWPVLSLHYSTMNIIMCAANTLVNYGYGRVIVVWCGLVQRSTNWAFDNIQIQWFWVPAECRYTGEAVCSWSGSAWPCTEDAPCAVSGSDGCQGTVHITAWWFVISGKLNDWGKYGWLLIMAICSFLH